MLLSGATSASGSVVKAVATSVIMRILNGSYNPDYKKLHQKKMRYIQQKYSLAYSDEAVEDPLSIIKKIGSRYFFYFSFC
jgi:hypothetical protein